MINELFDFLNSSDSDDYPSSSSSSSSSSDDEGESEIFASIKTFIETINEMGEEQFKSNFRLNRPTVLTLIEMYAESDVCPTEVNGGRCRIGAEKEIYSFLWYLGTTTTFRELGNLFGLRKSSIWRSVLRVTNWLVSIGHNFISWPQGRDLNEGSFMNIPGAIGAIDVAKIRIRRPRDNGQDYFDRKKMYSIALQAVVNSKKKIFDVCCGEPGSLHDARVLRRSSLYHRAETNLQFWFPNRSFIIGDSAYPSLPWLVPVYKNYGNLANQQRTFNYFLSSRRVTIEHVFGLIKGRFRRLLHFTEHHNVSFVVNLIICACILHNICIDQNDEFDDTIMDADDDEDTDTDDEEVPYVVQDRRQQLFNQMVGQNML